MTQETHQQPERFALMQYQCDACGHVEVIWNSRNAVTPFLINCGLEGCDGMKSHINWQADQRRSTLPAYASRVFVSITRADARLLAEKKWDYQAGRTDWPLPEGPKEDTLQSWADHIYGDGNRPYAISRIEYRRRQTEK